MNEGNISPLARRIAEENNVNWRNLQGSGPEGRIVERDVIAYLQRVTAGDEPVDPTPEPLPEGMEAWPEEDVAAYQTEQRQQSTAPAATDEDDGFIETEFGDDDLLDIEDLDDESLLEVEDDAPAPAITQRADDDFVAELDWGTSDEEEELGFDFSASQRAAPEEAHSGFAPPAEDEPQDEQEVVLEPEQPGQPAWREPEEELEEELEEDTVTLEASGADREEQVFLDDAPAERSWQRWDTPQPQAEAEAPAPPAQVSAQASADLEAAFPGAQASSAPADEGALEEAFQETISRDELGAASMEEAAAIPPAASAQSGQDDVSRQESASFLQSLPLMRSGLLARASLDLTPIVEAQAAVSRGIDQEDAPVATAFLLRAAAKALQESPLGDDDAPALALISEEGFSAARIAGAATASFRDLLQELATLPDVPAGDIEEAGVLVANLSDYDLDEAVLVVGMPVLALGRVFYDSSDDSYSSTLTLSGDLMPAQAAAFLGRVVELLGSPLELVI